MIRNHYLFSSQFRSYLQAQELEDEEFFAGFSAAVSNFLQHADQENLDALTQQAVGPILTQLQFANAPLEAADANAPARCGCLYDGFPLEKKVSCVHVVPTSPPERGQGWVLDMAEKGHFPAFDLIHLLKQENLEWGILTNGLVWRLYSTLSPQPYEQYLEIDFSDAGEEEFRVFWQLFSLALFLPDEQGVTPLETFIEESAREAEVIEKHIKSNIEEILENICFGLLSYAGKDIQPLSEADKQRYFENAVYLLFRLLFIFYAESRELLPLNHPGYRQHSLQALLGQAREWMQSGVVNPEDTELWDGFRDLCLKIEYGDRALGIPEYDGGLFDSQLHGFLSDAQHKVKNLYFVKVLYLLGYRNARKNRKTRVQSLLCDQPIDYRDLSVRSLGSLYEGILEYKLFIASEDLVLRKKEIVPVREAGKVKKSERVIEAGRVYFAQAANERHDSGSYYTPEYVVDYMVKNSVRVGLEERWQAFQPPLERYDRELRQAASEDLRTALLKKLDQELLRFVDEQVLSFKVVDPAMGSGHFLVNALNTITHFILEALQLKVQFTIDHSPFTIDHSHIRRNPALDLTPARWRRKAAERCIFGVDINPLAAELAKLSLWIASADAGKPLTFLNHHLKCGDSLMGIQLDDMLSYPGSSQGDQFTIWDVIDKEKIDAIKKCFNQFLSLSSDEIQDILSKKEEYEEIVNDPVLKHLKDMATLWTMISIDVNNKKGRDLFDVNTSYLPDENQYFNLFEKAQTVSSDEEWKNTLGEFLYKAIKEYYELYRHYHWELEFPEIINDKFDIVIGNPPYIQTIQITSDKREIFKQKFYSASGRMNIFYLFLEIAGQIAKSQGISTFIVPDRLLLNTQCEQLRKWLLEEQQIIEIVSFAEPIFENAVIDSIIIIYRNSKGPYEYINTKSNILRHNLMKVKPEFIPISYFSNSPNNQFNLAYDPKIEKLIEKVKNNSVQLSKIADVKDGIIQGKIGDLLFLNEPIDEDSKKLLFGKDITRYNIHFGNNWINYKPNEMMDAELARNQGKPPSIRLKKKELFERNKILTRQTADSIIAAYDTEKYYYSNTLHGTTIIDQNFHPYYVLGMLNSKLLTWYYRSTTAETGKVFAQIKIAILKKLPIFPLSFNQQQPFIDIVDQIIAKKHNGEDTAALEQQIDRMVYALYGLTAEEIAVVEGAGKGAL